MCFFSISKLQKTCETMCFTCFRETWTPIDMWYELLWKQTMFHSNPEFKPRDFPFCQNPFLSTKSLSVEWDYEKHINHHLLMMGLISMGLCCQWYPYSIYIMMDHSPICYSPMVSIIDHQYFIPKIKTPIDIKILSHYSATDYSSMMSIIYCIMGQKILIWD